MTERIVGIQLMPSPFPPGIAVVPVVPFPSTEAERTFTAEQASKAALLLQRPSPGQVELLRHLAECSPDGNYLVATAGWIETILKATKGFSNDAMKRLHSFDWTERPASPGELRQELLALLKPEPRKRIHK